MMETTVTMSLERYKQLESFELAFEQLKNDSDKFMWYTGYHGDYLIHNSNEANVPIKKVRDFENRTGKKVF